ncbi:MAG: hypothetical protein HY321_09225 [Armatimonadetes bacterium]|nr:hypothetical protein [Armatimonadota bacterium]
MATETENGITLPLVLTIGGTRVLGGIGLGLLLAEKMDGATRHSVGKALLAAGIASTIPLLGRVLVQSVCRG